MYNTSVVSMEPLTYYEINGLSAYWDYNFTITATNDIGSGNATDNFVFKTKPSGKCYRYKHVFVMQKTNIVFVHSFNSLQSVVHVLVLIC